MLSSGCSNMVLLLDITFAILGFVVGWHLYGAWEKGHFKKNPIVLIMGVLVLILLAVSKMMILDAVG